MELKDFNLKLQYLEEPLTTYLNDEGIEKKTTKMPRRWTEYEYQTKDKGHGSFLVTGWQSGIIAIDCDTMESFDILANAYPELHKSHMVRTRKGYHIYFKYDKKYGKGTRMKIDKVDFQTDGKCVYFSGTKVKRYDGSTYKYQEIPGRIIDIPPEIDRFIIKVENKESDEYEYDGNGDDDDDNDDDDDDENDDEVDEDRYVTHKIYDIEEHEFQKKIELIIEKNSNYMSNYEDWLKFTQVMKTHNQQNFWDACCRKYGGKSYNRGQNLKIWNGVNKKYNGFNVNHLIKETNDKLTNEEEKIPIVRFHKYVNDKELTGHVRDKYKFQVDEKDIKIPFCHFSDYKTIILESGTGTGKTNCVAENVKQYKEKYPNYTLLCINDLRTLGQQHIKSFNNYGIELHSYLNDKGIVNVNPTMMMFKDSMICINSLDKLHDCDFSNKILYIDEVYSLTYALTHNRTLDDQRLIISSLFLIFVS
jgi:hypothetical protein